MKPEKIGAGVIIFKNSEVLLVKHGQEAEHLNDTYGLPCGRLEPGEKAIDAAVRELKEETGLLTTTEDLHPFPNNYYEAVITFKNGTKLASMEIFLCSKYSGTLTAKNETTPEWVDLNKLDNLNLLPNVKNAIMSALAFIKQINLG